MYICMLSSNFTFPHYVSDPPIRVLLVDVIVWLFGTSVISLYSLIELIKFVVIVLLFMEHWLNYLTNFNEAVIITSRRRCC